MRVSIHNALFKKFYFIPPLLLLFHCISVSAQYDGGIRPSPPLVRLEGSQIAQNATLALGPYVPHPKEGHRDMTNVITLSIKEETTSYIPGNFTASVDLLIEYGQDANNLNQTTQTLTVTYDKDAGTKYNARQYFNFKNANYVKVTVINPPVAPVVNGFNTINVLVLENLMQVASFRELSNISTDLVPQSLTHTNNVDELEVEWSWSNNAGNNQTQLEWTWLENDPLTDGVANFEIFFHNNSTRVDLPLDKLSYSIPLLYGGEGRLFYRIRATNVKANGGRTDGPWSDVKVFSFEGHEDSLNWQVRTSFAEDGKRKTVVEYYDGSLRSRQTVTRDNVTNTTVTAETFYDAQGRPAIQILPVPGINNVIGYSTNLNLFSGQIDNEDPAKFFDLQPANTLSSITPSLQTTKGASRYYSPQNDEINNGFNRNIPDAEGYPYTVTRYTPDATGRVMRQSGVGAAFKMESGHETKYYYGTAAQEELWGLFGTEAGNYTHYFKNMVQDANGQMSVSYVDMHGRTIATALAGDAPAGIQALNLNSTDYPNQQGADIITRNLIDKNSNVVKGTSLEAVNTLLLPATTALQFRYELTPLSLQMDQCTGPTLCYDCMYDLEIAITEESGDYPPIIKRYNNIQLNADDNCGTTADGFLNTTNNTNIIYWDTTLPAGSYAVRKTLTVSQTSLERYRDMYIEKALCKTDSLLIDSLYQVMQTLTGCNSTTPAPAACESCLDGLGDFNTYKTNYIANLGSNIPSDQVIQAAYAEDIARCTKMCDGSSGANSLANIRQMMLADMMPYTGQYAKEDMIVSTMYQKYDIFSTSGYLHPLYRFPWNSVTDQRDFYYNINNNKDASIHLSNNDYGKLDTMSKTTFESLFQPKWAESLLPHHPEYQKLVFAETNLQPSYNWINDLSRTETWTDALSGGFLVDINGFGASPTDPFFDEAPAYKNAMKQAVSNSHYREMSLWQIAYGDAKCKTITDQANLNACYTNAPKDATQFSGLTTAELDQAWNTFKGLYRAVRDSLINEYIKASVPFTDGNDLVAQGYTLHFPESYNQTASQYDWDWFPSTFGGGPYGSSDGSFMQDSLTSAYQSRCSSYVPMWKKTLMQCPDIAELNDTEREQLLNEITSRMVVVCEKGSDAANPYGSSNVAPGVSAVDQNFENIINSVFAAEEINRSEFCNPFIIEFPKPYGKNPVFTKTYTTLVDTCNCKQFEVMKQEAANNNYDPYSFSSLNQYLSNTYGDTLTLVLYNGLLNCSDTGMKISCYTTYDTVKYLCNEAPPCGLMSRPSGGELDCEEGYYWNSQTLQCEPIIIVDDSCEVICPTTVCDTIPRFEIVLQSAQPLPEFLKCGFAGNSNCIDCDQLNSYIAQFKEYYGSHDCADAPFMDQTNLDSFKLRYNTALAQFINYRTGFQFNWIDYAEGIDSTGCIITYPYVPTEPSVTVICRDTRPLNDPTRLYEPADPCQRAWTMAVAMGQEINKLRKDSLIKLFEDAYINKCLVAKDSFTVTYQPKEYHYTLYYYDQAGNLVKTVPPKGVRPDFSNTFIQQVKEAKAEGDDLPRQHQYVTEYRYNSLNQVVTQKTPDAGISKFWYDRLGRLVVSQNAEQILYNKWSYTLYDDLGRITEVGQKPQTTAMTQTISQDVTAINNWININGGTREQITYTVYDLPYGASLAPLITQKNLRNRVSYTATKELATDVMHYTATFYTYDIHGNVDKLLQDYKGVYIMDAKSQRFKLITYNYDLISGKVNEVSYQPGAIDAFYHRYNYDAENKLVSVETSRDKIYWETDAQYQYYKHGPLARTRLGQLQVQGLDNSYTLQGWLKGINPVFGGSAVSGSGDNCDPGSAIDDLVVVGRLNSAPTEYIARNSITFDDGFESANVDEFETNLNNTLTTCTPVGNTLPYASEAFPVARDAFGFSLHYYAGDYKPIGIPNNSTGILGALGNNAAQLYNGNIAAMAVNIPQLGSAKVYNYHYDQLNRLVAMDAYNGLNISNGTFTPINISDYKESITYDPNGNIMSYLRNGSGATVAMDNMTYNYITNKNQLSHVDDIVASTNYTEDIDDQSVGNYTYDAIGNLKTDVAEGISSIEWNVYGKIKQITKTDGTTIQYSYDAAGNRISKTVDPSAEFDLKTTVYVRDASGNVMSVYEHVGSTSQSLYQKEVHMYGSSRLGMETIDKDVNVLILGAEMAEGFGVGNISTFTRGEKLFELSNHLGSVLVTVSDKKLGIDSDSDGDIDYYEADVVSANDMYPGGMQMPGRSYSNGSTYRYGFSGREKDNEIKGDGNSYNFDARLYDPRIARWYSTDSKEKPHLNPYNFVQNNFPNKIDPDGNDDIHFHFRTRQVAYTYTDRSGTCSTSYRNVTTADIVIVKTTGPDKFYHHKHYTSANGMTSERVKEFHPFVESSRSGLTTTAMPFTFGLITRNDRDIHTLAKYYSASPAFKKYIDARMDKPDNTFYASGNWGNYRNYFFPSKNNYNFWSAVSQGAEWAAAIVGLAGAAIEIAASSATANAFANGGTKLMSSAQIGEFSGSATFGKPAGTFIAPTAEVDALLSQGLSRSEIATKLGITDPAFLKGTLMRVDVSADALKGLNLRAPTGAEAGANSLFVPGGKTVGGVTEGVVNGIPKTGSGVSSKPVPGL